MATPKNDSAQSSLYKNAGQSNTYATETGLLVLPCADGAPVVTRVHKEYGVRRQAFDFAKDRTPPVYPAPAEDTARSVLLSKEFVVPTPVPIPGLMPTFKYQLSGAYTYLLPTPTDETTGFPAPRMPFKFPDMAAGAAAVAGAFAANPMLLTPAFASGDYAWPFLAVAPAFRDSTLSEGFDSAGFYSVDTLGRA